MQKDSTYASTAPALWRPFFNLTALLGAIIFTASRLQAPTVTEWLAVPAMLLFGNIAVYLIHRYPLHRYWRWHKFSYREHTIKHHGQYPYGKTEIHSLKEIANIVFPPPVVLAFVLGYIPLMWFLTQLVFSQNVAWLVALGCASYFLLYEFMHSLCHAPANHLLLKIPGCKFMWNHHRLHHDPKLMSKWNFNIVYPLCDYLFGTLKK